MLLLAACAREPSVLEPIEDLRRFADHAATGCASKPVAAYGGPFSGYWIAGIAADRDHVYVGRYTGDADGWLTILDPDGREVGRTELPGVHNPTSIAPMGDLVLVVDYGGLQDVTVVDVSDPAHPAPLGSVPLGRGGAPTAFSRYGDLAFTDGGEVHAIDLSDPADPVAVTFDGLPRLAAPLVVGDDLLASVSDGPGCALSVWDPSTDPPTERAPVDTGGVCLEAGLIAVDGGAIGIGWLDSTPATVRLEPGWTASAAFPLSLDRLDDLDAVGGDAFVLGRSAIVVGGDGDRPLAVASWSPGSLFLRGAASSGDRVYVGASAESGDFEGVVALEPTCR